MSKDIYKKLTWNWDKDLLNHNISFDKAQADPRYYDNSKEKTNGDYEVENRQRCKDST